MHGLIWKLSLPKFRKEKVLEISIRYLNMLVSYWRISGGCDNTTSVSAVSSPSHSSLFTPVIQPSSLDSLGQLGTVRAVVVGCDDGLCISGELHTLAAIVPTFQDHTSTHNSIHILAGCFLSFEYCPGLDFYWSGIRNAHAQIDFDHFVYRRLPVLYWPDAQL